MRPNSDTAIIAALQRVTNKRQAAKIRDVGSTATLFIERTHGGELWARGVDDGLYCVEYNASGAYVHAGLYKPGRVPAAAERSTDIDVVRDRGELPDEIRRCRHTGGGPQ